MRLLSFMLLFPAGCVLAQTVLSPELVQARAALAAKDFVQARTLFAAYSRTHPQDAQALVGLGDVDLALHHYEAAETDLRRATALQPELWVAHKDLVLVEAKLGRWEDFERERTVLRQARERGAPNITARESDVIDSFVVNGREWIVREYFVPVGRTQARYNFEHFTPEGKVEAYVSLERGSAVAPAEAVTIGKDAPASSSGFALNWYTGKGHGMIRSYTAEPAYEKLRSDVRAWVSGASRY